MTYSNVSFVVRGVNYAVFTVAVIITAAKLLPYNRGEIELNSFDWPLGAVFATIFIELAFRTVEHYWPQPGERRGFPVEKKDKQ